MVAVAVPVSPPDQHSPKLGHLASSQTVWRFNSLSFFLIWTYFWPPGIASRIHLGLGSGFFLVPTSTEYELLDWRCTKSERDGDSAANRARRPSRVWGNWGFVDGTNGGSIVEEKERVLVAVADLMVRASDVKRHRMAFFFF